jgi:predicted metalloprotease with PDZ domain
MLWVSEGISVYYQSLILVRAGFLNREEYFERVGRFIRGFEDRPGRRLQSAAEASFDTWMKFFSRDENSTNTTISYYDKGAALGLLLDLKIRHESENRMSLDDVMRALYRTYYRDEQRGFTDSEFREECERAAGCALPEIFDVYVDTTADIDYPKYFAYAGLEIDVKPKEQAGAYLGATVEEQGGRLRVASVEWDSPAQEGGLSAFDEIIALDGRRADARMLERTLAARRPGDSLRILVSRRGRVRELDVVLGKKSRRSFDIRPVADPDSLQSAILEDWLRRP